jgi:hypothetical protein
MTAALSRLRGFVHREKANVCACGKQLGHPRRVAIRSTEPIQLSMPVTLVATCAEVADYGNLVTPMR